MDFLQRFRENRWFLATRSKRRQLDYILESGNPGTEPQAPALGPAPAFAGASALREDALFAWWKSVSEPVASSVIEGNCVAVRRGGEQPGMNRQSVG
jgi:hypothetical protein